MNRIDLIVQALKALEPLANIPLEDMTQTQSKKPDQPIMGWNEHTLYIRDVLKAREVIAAGRKIYR